MIIIDIWGNEHKMFPADTFYITHRKEMPDWSLNVDHESQGVFSNLIDYPPKKFFGSIGKYLDFFNTVPNYLCVGGLSPEAGMISSSDFGKILSEIPEKLKHDVYNLLYVEDIRDEINFIQNALLDIKLMTIEFYASLYYAKEIAVFPARKEGIFLSYGGDLPFVYLEGIFQKMFTVLDLSVKLCKSIDFTPPDYAKYHKINTESLQWSDRKKEKRFNFAVLEEYEYYSELQSLRNDFTHNRSWEASRKIYFETDDKGNIMKSWIYLHDHSGKYINRHRFYSQDLKINLLLPKMIQCFYLRIKTFISEMYDIINV